MTFKERLGVFETEQKVCEIGGVKFGGQPGEYPTVVCSSIFQKGDRIFEGKRKVGFNEKRAGELLKTQDKLWAETGVPGMADIVANTGKEFKLYVDFVTTVSDMPFCVDAWKMKPKLEGAAYCAEKGLMDRMFYNSLTVWRQRSARSPRWASSMCSSWPLTWRIRCQADESRVLKNFWMLLRKLGQNLKASLWTLLS